MAAITAAENGVVSPLILEATSSPLQKVLISGGGRCNITHACWDSRDLVDYYPRGRQALLGAFHRFACADVVNWFSDRGLKIVAESDGRMFPSSNRSSSVIDCLRSTSEKVGVSLRLKSAVRDLQFSKKNGFLLTCKDDTKYASQKVLLATGGHPLGRRLSQLVGHSIVQPVPSLFSLGLDASWLKDCSGIALDNIALTLHTSDKKFQEIGRVLLTHWGISGPAVLRLTAFAARELHRLSYKGRLTVNWLANFHRSSISKILNQFRYEGASKTLLQARPFRALPKRLWLVLLKQIRVDSSLRWAELSSQQELALLEALTASQYEISGRGPFGEEFVTAGGVPLDEVDSVRLESRICPGLYFAGELIDIDGVTGGFNFQHCWTSGWLAGKAIAYS